MGLFDKFRKKVREAASEVDSDELSAEEGSDEALEALSFQEQVIQTESQLSDTEKSSFDSSPNLDDDEDWEDFDEEEELELPSKNDDEWDDWEEEEEYTLPTKLSRKEKKILAKEAKKEAARKKSKEKEMI